MRNQPGRMFLCARCRAQVVVCSHCDRGQRYCAEGCAQLVRKSRQREAGQRYQRSRTGRFKHADRTRKWRASCRHRLGVNKETVTHQGSPVGVSDAVLGSSEPMAIPPGSSDGLSTPCTVFPPTTLPESTGTQLSALPIPTLRCFWLCAMCRTLCPAFVRQGFLRRRWRSDHGHFT